MTAPNYILEACVDSLASAVAAEQAGADRLELCAALSLGGLTPSSGLVEAVCEAVQIPVYILLRPRAGNFSYSEGEMEAMLRDARHFRTLGAAGMVTGVLDAAGNLHRERTQSLLEAGELPVTFHRAFDHCQSPREAVEALAEIGVERILSSGQKASALDGAPLLRALNQEFGEVIAIMPGGGISPDNISKIAALTGAREFHFSAIRPHRDPDHQGPALGKGGIENQHFQPHPQKVAAMRSALNSNQA